MTKDDRIVEIAKGLGAMPRLDPAWRSLAMVFTFDGKYPSNFGYCFTGDGADDWKPVSNREDELDDEVTGLRETLAEETGSAFSQVLFRLERETGRIAFDFAYEGKRWEVTPRNVAEVIAAIRP
ncbi:hypothetical protein [Chenggangzhangella methanolivorans]|uniref:Uncharacterized protein n=1 Tax=Chenggangzhangella methanolivorans TaxID=1437009 RepID=A0A9E6RI22_9HYPH|nr:hypothetical protein [Chenggangzhangella methanolivorans]QZO01402.1 hypothetical protein K6K41_08080 [Chenggangzhangella methanolivorans]